MKISIEYSDGRYCWRSDPKGEHEVPDSTIAMWEAADRLQRSVQEQLKTLSCISATSATSASGVKTDASVCGYFVREGNYCVLDKGHRGTCYPEISTADRRKGLQR